MKKIVDVVAAIIVHDNKILATQRGYGEFEGGWEFPGGKIEDGETPQQALVREIDEELGVKIVVGDLLTTEEFDYPEFHLSMKCYMCGIDPKSDGIVLKEHEDSKWLKKDDLDLVDWLPADREVVEVLKRHAGEHGL